MLLAPAPLYYLTQGWSVVALLSGPGVVSSRFLHFAIVGDGMVGGSFCWCCLGRCHDVGEGSHQGFRLSVEVPEYFVGAPTAHEADEF